MPHAHNQMTTLTTLRVDNLHCASCVSSIANIIAGISSLNEQKILRNATSVFSDVSISLQERTVSFTHPIGFNLKQVLKQLDAAGFDVWLPSRSADTSPTKIFGKSTWNSLLSPFASRAIESPKRQASHREICDACRTSKGYSDDSNVVSNRAEKQALQESRFAIEGMSSK